MARSPALPILTTPPPAALEAAGWMRRFAAAPPRLSEMVELYRTLGHEVHLEPLGQDEYGADCDDCAAARVAFRTIYTRRLP
jgi:hypothetical protein